MASAGPPMAHSASSIHEHSIRRRDAREQSAGIRGLAAPMDSQTPIAWFENQVI